MNIVDEYKDQILAYLMQAYNNHLNLPLQYIVKLIKKKKKFASKNQAVALLIFFQLQTFHQII